ncbi:MAG: DUF4199 domain-containing protein [Salinivirgaceae bacterium]|nr:DUF4199 domain-containing protein [Salinivirgaceae bacterium]
MQNNLLYKHTMTYGLYVGLAFSFIVFVMHLAGYPHVPGDSVGVFNALLMAMAFLYFGRKFRDQHFPEVFLYRHALGFAVLLSVFAAFIYSFFSYFYYAYLEPEGINYFIEQMRLAYSEKNKLPKEQVDALVELYKNSLNPGSMAAIVFFYQVFSGVLLGLVMAVFVKTPARYDK